MKTLITLPLKLTNNRSLFLDTRILDEIKAEIETFLDGESYMNSLTFSKKMLFSHEIQANNTIEGYNDDISIIESIIKRTDNISDIERRTRILNLYKAYKYILNGYSINKETLKELYSILSKGLLLEEEMEKMGPYYRINPSYIYFSCNVSVEPDEGADADKLDGLMESLFEYINSNNEFDCMTDYFIKSQIIHFYFVYLHPYYDINGRTGRTLSIWYLLQSKAYPFIIFNRGIILSKNTYYDIIKNVKKFPNITSFIRYMLENVKIELEKEYVMEALNASVSQNLTPLDYQTLHLILSTNGVKTLSDFTAFYNSTNETKKIKQVFEEMFVPLLDKGLIKIERETKKIAFDNQPNFVYNLDFSKADIDRSKIKRLNLS